MPGRSASVTAQVAPRRQELSHTEALGIRETALADFEYLQAVQNTTDPNRMADVFAHGKRRLCHGQMGIPGARALGYRLPSERDHRPAHLNYPLVFHPTRDGREPIN